MKSIEIIKTEIEAIMSGIKKYTSDTSVLKKTDALIENLKSFDIDYIQYFLKDINDWYDTQMNNIRQNTFVRHPDTHIKNKKLLEDIINEIEQNIDDYKKLLESEPIEVSKTNIDNSIENIFNKFHCIAVQIRHRYNDRESLDIVDEYDVQDLLHALLCLYCEDIRPEEWSPSYAGTSTRQDFLLKNEKIIIEVKKTRKGLGNKELKEQLLIDIAQYKEHPDCDKIVCFIYDPDNRVNNPRGFERDIEKQSTDKVSIRVYVRPIL